MSNDTNEWGTPQWLFDQLNEEFIFTLDPAASHTNHKCKKYFTIEDDGLSQSWSNEIVFLNPPYGREVGVWVKKAYEESFKNTTVVCVIASRTDTQYWHDFVMQSHEIRLIKGRLKFELEGKPPTPAPFPSAVVIFHPWKRKELKVTTLYQSK